MSPADIRLPSWPSTVLVKPALAFSAQTQTVVGRDPGPYLYFSHGITSRTAIVHPHTDTHSLYLIGCVWWVKNQGHPEFTEHNWLNYWCPFHDFIYIFFRVCNPTVKFLRWYSATEKRVLICKRYLLFKEIHGVDMAVRLMFTSNKKTKKASNIYVAKTSMGSTV